MPKKGRNARHARTQAAHSQNTSGRSSPAPALLDLRVGTPDVATSTFEPATPEFSIRIDRGDDGVTGAMRAIQMDDSLADMPMPAPRATRAPMMEVRAEEEELAPATMEEYARPSPLELSPMPQPPVSGALIDVEEPVEEALTDVGHVRAPVIPTEPTPNLYDSISRTVRGVSSALPRALPTPPRVSRPVSFGSFFSGQGQDPASPQAQSPTAPVPPSRLVPTTSSPGYGPADRQGPYPVKPTGAWSPTSRPLDAMGRRRSSAASSNTPNLRRRAADEVSVLDLDDGASVSSKDDAAQATRYGGVRTRSDEEVVFSAWDTLVEGLKKRRVLLIGYTSGLQVWDCTDLGSVKEIVNLSSGWGKVTCIRVLPAPSTKEEDPFAGHRPLLGVIAEGVDGGDTSFTVYSLLSHRIVHRLDLPAPPNAFSANSAFIAISTSIPLSLNIYSPTTFTPLFNVPTKHLVPFVPDISNASATQRITNVLSTHLESSLHSGQVAPKPPTPPPPPPPRAVYALSGRLLAFASPPPRNDDDSSGTTDGVRPRVRTLSSAGASNTGQHLFSVGGVAVSQADIGHAAVKVGSGVLSGMRTLGGLAYGAAKSRLAGPQMPDAPAGGQGRTGGWFSKSAPAASGVYSGTSSVAESVRGEGTHAVAAAPGATASSYSFSGHSVRILDLAPLSDGGSPELIAEFVASTSSPIAQLAFTADGGSLIVAPKDGQVVKVFKLNPAPSALRSRAPFSVDSKGEETLPPPEAPEHIYDLRRGRSAGVIERIDVDPTGRWLGIGTRNGTVHVFAVNPYGGKGDERSHLEGRVRNAGEAQHSPTTLSPIVRLRSRRPTQAEGMSFSPLAFTFLRQSTPLPSNLRPAPAPYITPTTPNLSLPPSPAQRPVSASPSSGGVRVPAPPSTNFQDTLLFDPVDGNLSLRRATLERKRTDSQLSLSVSSSVPVLGGTSMSLPSMAPLSRLGSSPPPSTGGSSPQAGSGLSQMMDGPTSLVARESTVATWSLKRAKEWKEIRQAAKKSAPVPERGRTSRIGRPQWIAQAELSTFSRAPALCPRSMYLTHQFNFYGLGEDYHALIRRFQFDIPGPKIDVRREVEVSAYPNTGGYAESFHGATSPRDIGFGHGRTASSVGVASFDESLSSALSGGLEYSTASPRQLPMYPNGVPGSQRGGSYAPIRAVAAGLGEGVTEGLGRLRRGMGQVRSPRTAPQAERTNAGVPLEFGEDDFVLNDDQPNVIPPSAPASVPRDVPAPQFESHQELIPEEPLELPSGEVHGDDAWSGWDAQDRQAIDDAERFDEFVVGDLDEDQTRAPPVVSPEPAERPRGAKGKKKGRK